MNSIIKAKKEQIPAIVTLLIEHIDYIYFRMFPGTNLEDRKKLLSKLLSLIDKNNFLEFNRFYCYVNEKDKVVGLTGLITTHVISGKEKISYIIRVLTILLQSLSFIHFLYFLLSLYKNRDLFTSDVNDSGYITYIIVSQEYQKKSIGTQLLNYSIDHFKQKGYNEISLVVRSGNEQALNFFIRNGFREIKRKKDKFIEQGEKVIMIRKI